MSDAPEQKKPADPIVTAPAVHTDALWDREKLAGGVLTNVDVTPIPASDMTKQEYFRLLNERGLRLKNQQESSTGPERDLDALAAEEAATVAARHVVVAPEPFSKRDAELFHAYEAVLRQYRLMETLQCNVCFEANRPAGCQTVVMPHVVRVQCRCGSREYRPPTGTSDLPVTLDRPGAMTSGRILSTDGRPTERPAVLLPAAHAAIIRAYTALLAHRRLSHTLFCRDCWQGRLSDQTALQVSVTDNQIVYLCACRIRVYQA